jgi:hypothetical protein
MTIKNDVSFVVDMRLGLYEQQSTVNPNMPLRNLLYVSQVYEELVVRTDLYSRKRIMLPAPHFITFYNGEETQPERRAFRLSDSYNVGEQPVNLELIVIQLNINPGYNEKLKEKCPALCQYMIFVDRVRKYRENTSLQTAVERAVEECIAEGILEEFLRREKAKVISMSILYEFDQELHDRTLYQEGREEGRELYLIVLVSRMIQQKIPAEKIAAQLGENVSKIKKICSLIEENGSMVKECDAEIIYEKLQDGEM